LARRSNDPALAAITDDLGRFRFADIKLDSYQLTVQKYRLLDGAYGSRTPENEQSVVRIDSGARTQA